MEPIVIVSAVIILLAIVLPIVLAKRESKKKGLATALAVSKSNHPSNRDPEVPKPISTADFRRANGVTETVLPGKTFREEAQKATARHAKLPTTPKPVQKFSSTSSDESYEAYQRRVNNDIFPSYAVIAAAMAADANPHYVEPQPEPQVEETIVEETVTEVKETESFSNTPEPTPEPTPTESYSSFSYTSEPSYESSYSSSSYSSSSDSSSSYSSSSYDSGSSSSSYDSGSSSSFSFD